MAPKAKRARRKSNADGATDGRRTGGESTSGVGGAKLAAGMDDETLDVTCEVTRENPICVHGACVLRCLSGEVDVHGYVVRAGSSSDVVIRSSANVASVVTIETECEDGASVRLRAADGVSAFFVAEVGKAQQEFGWLPTMISPQWKIVSESVVHEICTGGSSAVVACLGPKGVGKSTLSRHVANGILSKLGAVCWLDLDCGQPELTAPGMVSLTILRVPLLGPPQLHQASGAEFPGAPSVPICSSFIGDTSPQSDPDAYVAGALRCLNAWQDLGEDKPPLVVNTSGWVKGLGLELTDEILREIGDQAGQCFAVNIRSHVASRNAPDVEWFRTESSIVPRIYEVPAGLGTALKGHDADGDDTSVDTFDTIEGASAKSVSKRSASDSRALAWLAWSRQTVAMCNDVPTAGELTIDDSGENETFNATAADLMAARPWRVSFDDVVVHTIHAQLKPRETLMALNGALVGLLKGQHRENDRGNAECVGLGVVRGVDYDKRYIYILTPAARDKLKSVETIALGKLEFPPKLLGAAGEYPYMQVGSIANEGSGSKAIKSRSNILRQNTAPRR